MLSNFPRILYLTIMNLEELKNRNQELEILNTIATLLNREVELTKALSITLQHSIELMNLETGWIWLFHPASNSVFLAASHNLPPAFTQHPERLSGWCYCIDKYLANNLETATNISEITCTRLKDLEEGTAGLRSHATIPLMVGEEKIGLLNMLSAESGQLTTHQLNLLHTIGEMLSVAVQRTRLFENSKQLGIDEERKRLSENMESLLLPDLKILLERLDRSDSSTTLKNLIEKNIHLTEQTFSDLKQNTNSEKSTASFQYPITPLSTRELEVLELLKLGKPNKAIATQLFIAERTVKFHVSSILSKLQAGNRTEAVRIASQRGL